ncbi:MAG: tetratricopeptide repeat protein [Fibrobacteria bacterium]
MEVSAKRKKRNQFISVLIIVAIVLMGVIVWGWIELQKSRNAERIKNALNSQIEPGFKEPEAPPEPAPETSAVEIMDSASVPKPPADEPAIAAPVKQETVQTAEAPLKQHKQPVKAVDLPKEPGVAPVAPVVEAKPVPEPKPVAVKPVKPVPVPKPIVAEPPIQVAMQKPDPIPAAPVTPAPKTVPTAPAKTYAPEDLPLPEKAEPTDELKQAVAAVPAPAFPKTEATPDAPVASGSFTSGLSAYKQQDYVNAIHSFTAVPRPVSKKRGAQDRDEYVQANFLKGVSLLKVGHMSEAVSAFQNVLEYEKYYPLANMNLGICYVELKQYAKAHQAFEAVVRDQSFIEPAVFDDVMQRTKYFWALAWTRLYKNATNPDKQNFYRQQAVLKWKDYEVWFSKNDKYKNENMKAENYLKSLSSL